jgi:MraZ protein
MSKRIPSGEHPVSLDGKGRVVIPVPFREYLRDGLVLTRGFEGGIDVITLADWAKLEERLEGLPLTDPATRNFVRFYYAPAQKTKLDGQGRVLIPPTLRRFAGLTDRAVVTGVMDRIEIWDEGRFFEYLEKTRETPFVPESLRDIVI